MHLPAHLFEVPARQLGRVLRLMFLSFAELAPVDGGCIAVAGICRMVEDVTRLELTLIARLLKNEILGEGLAVIADVQPREEDIAAGIEPEDAELPQLVVRKRLGRAGIAPAHVPGVFEKNRAHLFVLDLLREERFVERREVSANEERDVDVAR